MGLEGSLPGPQLFLHEDMGVPHALCHVSPFHATKSWILWLVSKSTSNLHVGNGLSPTVWCPWAGDTTAVSSRCCQDHSPAMLGRSAARGAETQPPWMTMLAWLHSLASRCLQNIACMPGSHAGAPASPDQLCYPTEGTGTGTGARQSRASCNAAPSSVRFVICAPVTQEHFKLVSCTCLCCTSQHNQNQSIIVIRYVNKVNK